MTACLCVLAASLFAGGQPPGGPPSRNPYAGPPGYPVPGFGPGMPPGMGPLPAPLQATILEFQRLSTEVNHLRGENARLRAEVERLRKAAKPSSDRFRDRGDRVEDTKTGLLWQKNGSAAGQLNYFEAHRYAVGLTLGGVAGGWRLPTRAELKAVYPAAAAPFENIQHNPERPDGPGKGPMPSYWTGDLDTRLPDYAYVFHWYGAGGANNSYACRNKAWVRCVHDPLAAKPKGPPAGSGAGVGPVLAAPADHEPPCGVVP